MPPRKRPPLHVPEIEHQGIRAVLRPPELLRAEAKELARREANGQYGELDSMTVSSQDSMDAEQQDSKIVRQHVKVMVYLTEEHLLALERMRMARLERGQRLDRSALVRQAIDLLSQQENS